MTSQSVQFELNISKAKFQTSCMDQQGINMFIGFLHTESKIYKWVSLNVKCVKVSIWFNLLNGYLYNVH